MGPRGGSISNTPYQHRPSTTLALTMLARHKSSAARLHHDGQDLSHYTTSRALTARNKHQILFSPDGKLVIATRRSLYTNFDPPMCFHFISRSNPGPGPAGGGPLAPPPGPPSPLGTPRAHQSPWRGGPLLTNRRAVISVPAASSLLSGAVKCDVKIEMQAGVGRDGRAN